MTTTDLSQWDNFFIMVGGGAAALAGLVFIAMSINLSTITRDLTHKNRAIATLTGFTAVFMVCGLALAGRPSYQWLGAEWLTVTVIPTITYIRVYVQARRAGRSSLGLSVSRFFFGTGCYGAQLVGSAILISGRIAGLYLAAAAMIASFGFFISAAWLLIVGPFQPQDPHH